MKLFLIFILGLFIGGIRKKTLMREEEKYLIRISLFKCKWFTIKLHKALMSDPAVPHDHPWNLPNINIECVELMEISL